MLALDPGASGGLAIANDAIVTNPLCGVAVNSGNDTAIKRSNNAVISGPLTTHGNWSLSNGAHLNGNPLINHGPVVLAPPMRTSRCREYQPVPVNREQVTTA
jgi:hypothetical protein